MNQCVDGPNIFNPSTSWIWKAGVKVDYAPEDTLKSVIFGDTDTPVGNIVTETGPTKNQLLSQGERTNSSSAQKRPSPNRTMVIKPAPFLKRRQGMAAWCSKMKRQGIPVRDPAEELRKKHISTDPSPGTQHNPTAVAQPVKQCNLPRPLPQNIVDGFSPPAQESPLQDPVGGLLCGIVPRKKPHANEVTTQQFPPQHSISYQNANPVTNYEKLPNPAPEPQPDIHNEVSDLEEFELLEEIAENSSFSSLTTSFVSKLGQTSLRDRLQRAEERLERLALVEGSTYNGNRNADVKQNPPILNDENGLHRANSQAIPDRNILSTADKGRPNSAVGILRSGSAERPADGILAKDGQKKGKKVARFHLVRETTSTSRDEESANTSLHEQAPQERQAKNENTRQSMEFDDMNSWACTTTSMNDVQYNQRSPVSPRHCTSSELANGSTLDAEQCSYRSRHPSPSGASPLRGSCSETTLVSKRPVTTAGTHRGGSKSPSPHKPVVSSYEAEIITLADEFVEKMKREPHSALGRSYTESQAAIRQWITRLESEVRRFKTENTNLLRLKAEREESMRRLESETKKFEEMKAKERKLFEDYKENELRKLRKERRVLDEYQRALKVMPTKKEREEIERLKEELHEARSDLSRREVRWHAAIARLRARIEELEAERDELKARTRRLEEDRIELQAQLNASRTTSGSLTTGQIRRTASSVGISRQSLNAVTQSISLKKKKGPPSETCSLPVGKNDRRTQRDKQPVSSYRLSSRPGSHAAGLDTLVDVSATRRSLTGASTGDRPISARESVSSCGNPCSTIPRRATSTEGTRESVHSGGYFTGEDDCLSLASGGNADTERHETKGDVEFDRIPPVTTAVPVTVVQPSFDRSRLGNSNTSKRKLADEKLPVPGTAASGAIVRSVKHPDGSSEETYANGATVVSYSNGSVKEVFPDRKTILVSLFNGDIKRTLPDGRVIYHYAGDGTVQVTYPDGTEEINYADGRQEIIHPKPIQKTAEPVFGDVATKLSGTELVSRRLPNGDREICLPNGQREIHSITGIKCRIYPDGTTKTVFPDGRHETRYSSGRIRIKDAQGNLILDTRLPVSGQPLLQSANSTPPPQITIESRNT